MENLFRPSCIKGKANTMTYKNCPQKKTWELPKELEKIWQLWICRNQCFSGVFFRWFTQDSTACNVLLLQSVGVLLSYLFPTKPTRKDCSRNHPAAGDRCFAAGGTWTHPFPTEILPITWPKGWPQLSYGFRDRFWWGSTHWVQPPGTEGYKVEKPSPHPGSRMPIRGGKWRVFLSIL